MTKKVAVIIGGGPAGLTAALELLRHTDIKPIIYEMESAIGGICKTIDFKGNRIDIGGHRFFSKSDRILEWWQHILPLQGEASEGDRNGEITYQGRKKAIPLKPGGPDPDKADKVLLIRPRHSRIYFLKTFFNHPLAPSLELLRCLGFVRSIRFIVSYLKAKIFPIKPEVSLEDFIINRFGKELYRTFFKSYTEKVWGVNCHKIKAEWGAQRIKGLDLRKALLHPLKSFVVKDTNFLEKNIETSLVQRFLYPKLGPGQMWDEVARLIEDEGGEIHRQCRIVGLKSDGERIVEVQIQNGKSGASYTQQSDYVFSSMPVKELIRCFGKTAPDPVVLIADGLMYRDFITVGILLKKLRNMDGAKGQGVNGKMIDNWIYIQEDYVKVGRLQIYNNWSPYMVKDANTAWVGMEYFCNEGDALWRKTDEEIKKLAIHELIRLGFADPEDVLDGTVIRMPKAYPAYFGTYDRFDVIRKFTDKFENLFLIGRNGMHKYNNQDHSMLTAITAVENIVRGIKSKDNIWDVNTEMSYQEER